jgi:tRNA A-37 threonylcarbamoyl transferase component Bud32
MNQESRLLDLVVEWEERRAAGEAVSPEDLCRDSPELLEELRARLQAMSGMNKMLDAQATASWQASPPRADPQTTQSEGKAAGGLRSIVKDAQPAVPGYEIFDEIGRGGMGVVFKARHVALNRVVALKTLLSHALLRADNKRRFVQEAKVMALLQHPNIVQIYEIGEVDGHPFMAMEYVPGQTLRDRQDAKPWAPNQAAEMVAILARAVQAAHAHGIIHRDLKPNNILLTADGVPKICDFGVAKCLADPSDHTRTGQLMGTPCYMAPEQVVGDPSIQGPGVDVYALGVILYELLIGRPPFLADNPVNTLQLVTSQEPVPPRRLQPRTPRDLETICLKCLEKIPSRRYPTAQELADDLALFLAGKPIRSRPVGFAERCWRWCRLHPSIAALVAVAVLAVVVVLGLSAEYHRRLADELRRTAAAHREVLTTQEKLQHTLTLEIASRVDGDLRQLAAVPQTLAALLENHRDSDEQHLERDLMEMLRKTPMIFGLCVAMEPFQWRKDQENFALYVYRRADGLAAKHLVPPDYLPHYRTWQWYRTGKDSPQGTWGEPYIGEGGDKTPMVTFSAAIQRDGRFVGVVSADLAMDYFHQLRTSMDRLDVGPGGHCFLVSSGHRILAHLEDRYEFPSPESELDKLPIDASLREVVRRWTNLPSGATRAIDFSTGKPASFQFARVPSAAWTLVVVMQ